ncbi:MAG TPA: hypothetical protein VMM93_06160 [Vicinamibacterales bacterium]|nr:hypothetical protein [Vicinamibacterales bacterium]
MTRPVRSRLLRLSTAFVLVPALAAAACGNRIEILHPTGNPLSAALTVETFAGVLPVDGSRFYSFTVPQNGLVGLTLLSLIEDGEPSPALVNVAIGVPRATDCSPVDSRTVNPSATPLLRGEYPAGIYCVRIADVDTLTVDATFAINISRPK